MTITTVGYGDHYPISAAGRIMASLLMVAGIGLFGTFTAFVADLFMQEEGAVEDARCSWVGNQLNTQASILTHNLTRELQMMASSRKRGELPKRPSRMVFMKLEPLRNPILRGPT